MKTLRPFNLPLFILLLVLSFPEIYAQVNPENPPIPVKVEVRTSQFLNFGSFTGGNTGGNVVISPEGVRTADGDIFLLNMGSSPSPALFDVYANPGTIIHIQKPFEIVLTNGNGGRIYLRDFNFNTGQTFVTQAAPGTPHEVYVGGTLRVSNSVEATPGNYQGTFTLTFIHQ